MRKRPSIKPSSRAKLPAKKADIVEDVTFAPDYSASFPTFYGNWAIVTHTATDLAIDICLLSPPYQAKPETKTALVRVVTRVVIPPVMGAGLIDALQKQLTKLKQEIENKNILIPFPSE